MGSSNCLGSCWFSLFPAGLLPVPRLPQNHAYTIHAHSSPEGHHLGSGQQEPRQVFTLDRPGLSFFIPKYPDHSNNPHSLHTPGLATDTHRSDRHALPLSPGPITSRRTLLFQSEAPVSALYGRTNRAPSR